MRTQTATGMTALHCAAKKGHRTIERFLEQHMAAAAEAMAAALIAEETAAARQPASGIVRTASPAKALTGVTMAAGRSQRLALHPVAPYCVHTGFQGHIDWTRFWLGPVGGPRGLRVVCSNPKLQGGRFRGWCVPCSSAFNLHLLRFPGGCKRWGTAPAPQTVKHAEVDYLLTSPSWSAVICAHSPPVRLVCASPRHDE
jgi:hypothetical protein